MFQSAVATALFFGLLSAATLPLGAAVGVAWRPSDRVLAFLLAFGGGALLAALTIDLIAPGVDHGHFESLALGAILGGLLFKWLDWVVNRQGGYLRKPSTAMTYWRNQARKRIATVLKSLRRTHPLGQLSGETRDDLLEIMLVREVPAGTCLYRVGDPSSMLFIIEDGEVELSDPAQGGRVFEHLHKHDVFGRMSFFTGCRRATEAHTVTDCKLLIVPRDPLMDLLTGNKELREVMARHVDDAEVQTYLEERHRMDPERAATWRKEAVESLIEDGHYDPPFAEESVPEDLVGLLASEQRLGLFSGLAHDTLARIAKHLVHKTNPRGHNYFHMGHAADRFYLLRRGTVYLFDPNERSRKPIVVEAGQCFGGLSFLTEGSHAATAVGSEETAVSVLRRSDFDDLIEELPDLRAALSILLQQGRIAEYLTRQHHLDAKRAAGWMDKAAKSVEGGRIFPSLADMTSKVAGYQGAAMAMFLGIMLDGIPESLVIGANVLGTGGISLSLLSGLLLANLPEALSSAAGMKEQGMRVTRILGMWTSLMLMTGLGAAIGAVLLREAPGSLFALIEGVAAGAMLTMVAETMLPEAFHKGGGIVGLSTLAGFLVAIFFNTLG